MEINKRIFNIAKSNEIYLDDDHQSAIDLHPLYASDEPELTQLYERFASKWISESVKRTVVYRGKFFITERSKKLYDVINYCLDMLFVNNRIQFLLHAQQIKREEQKSSSQLQHQKQKPEEIFPNHLLTKEKQRSQSKQFHDEEQLLLIPSQLSSRSLPYNNFIENLSSRIERNSIENFSQYKNKDDIDMNDMIGKNKSYTERKFNRKESSRTEINNSWKFTSSSNMIRYTNVF
ncbi:unnamed protein product [Rotaria sp. Silwood1]|nr:unnamed protein product [Rotaria sp. Silwood1]